MVRSVLIHGRQPAIGRAELESLYGADAVSSVGEVASSLTILPEDVEFGRLGGSIKLAKILTILETTDWQKIEAYLAKTIPEHLRYVPEGKFKLGLSVYGLSVRPDIVSATGLRLKKLIKVSGRSVRIIPNKELELNSASVLHNQLTGPTGWELILIRDGNSTLLAQTTSVQDIDAYAARDQARPKRDARVGMLPPKLAQIIINLAKPDPGTTVLDPFCGTGVVLQEASLMGFNVYGSDLEPRMVEYSQANLEWLNVHSMEQRVEQGDATDKKWDKPFDVIAAETYLGRPFSALPNPKILDEVVQDVDTIHRKFLINLATQTKAGFRLCIAIPAWKTKTGFQHLKMLDSLEELGYTRVSFQQVSNRDLVYHRENQIVARELIVLTRS